MARPSKKTIEEQIELKKDLIINLTERLKMEQCELDSLLNQQREKEVERLYFFLKSSNLSVEKATSILTSYQE